MAAPSPWGSRPVGDPVVRRRHTSEAEVGAPLIPLLGLTGQCPSPRRCVGLTVHAGVRVGGGCQTLLPPGAHFHHWGLGFKQSSFHHVGRVERDLPYSVFWQSRLSPQYPGQLLPARVVVHRYSPMTSCPCNTSAAHWLGPFALWSAFPTSDYYGPSVPSWPAQQTTRRPACTTTPCKGGCGQGGSHVHQQPFRR